MTQHANRSPNPTSRMQPAEPFALYFDPLQDGPKANPKDNAAPDALEQMFAYYEA
jgi:hypothetical protein